MEKLNVKEIRIGNLIDRGDYICKVESLDVDGNICSTPIDYKGERFVEQIDSPIPLTEEWLLKFGFAYNDNGEPQIDTNEGYALSISIGETPYKYTAWHVIKKEYKYWMLYFALTGKELERK